MITKPDDPAFSPVGNSNGMTKREAFAAAALQGLNANPDLERVSKGVIRGTESLAEPKDRSA